MFFDEFLKKKRVTVLEFAMEMSRFADEKIAMGMVPSEPELMELGSHVDLMSI